MSTTQNTSRPYPRRCPSCRETAVHRAEEPRVVPVRYDGAMYDVGVPDFPVNRCTACGAVTVGAESDEAVNRALRDHIGLLQPAEIRAAREELRLTQQQLAAQIGCASESMSRWETGSVVQSRSIDRALRLYFQLPQARVILAALATDRTLGRRAVLSADAVAGAYAGYAHVAECLGSRQPLSNLVQLYQGEAGLFGVVNAQPTAQVRPTVAAAVNAAMVAAKPAATPESDRPGNYSLAA